MQSRNAKPLQVAMAMRKTEMLL